MSVLRCRVGGGEESKESLSRHEGLEMGDGR